MLFDLFAIWSIPFWILAGVTGSYILWAMDEDNGLGATVTLLLFSLALWLFGDFNIFKAIWHHPHEFGEIIGIYLVGGFIYVWPKWFFFNHSLKDKLLQKKKQFLERNNVTEESITPELVLRWQSQYRDDFAREIGNYDKSVIPKVRNYKSKVITWMTYWPFSLFWTLTHDLIHKIWNAVWHSVHDGLQKMSANIFKGADLQIKR